MMAPVLVPAKKSKWSARTSLGAPRLSRRRASMRKSISRLKTPRIPPPSNERMRFIRLFLRELLISNQGSPLDQFRQKSALDSSRNTEDAGPCSQSLKLDIPGAELIV